MTTTLFLLLLCAPALLHVAAGTRGVHDKDSDPGVSLEDDGKEVSEKDANRQTLEELLGGGGTGQGGGPPIDPALGGGETGEGGEPPIDPAQPQPPSGGGGSTDQGNGGVSSTGDCIEALFIQARLRTSEIPRYVQGFRNNGFDQAGLKPLDFLGFTKLLGEPRFGFDHAGDVFSLFDCLRNGICLTQPFCQNGGQCVHEGELARHQCSCPRTSSGDRCEQVVEDPLDDIRAAITTLQRQQREIADAQQGVSYTHWARTTCPSESGATLVYAGRMSGAHHTHHGGGANHLCLPDEPIYEEFRAGHQSHSLIYVAEFETGGFFEPYGGLHEHNPVCAVCLTAADKKSTITIPARNVCPQDWTLEYSGYLMASHHGHRRVDFICVDRNPEVVPNTQANNNGDLLYFIEAVCQSEMACPPYNADKELTCAVCSR